jgi:hypothetical protein
MMNKIILNIAGEQVPVLFDGSRVTSPDFPDIEVEFFAQCGHRISQQMLVDICHDKLEAIHH